ncbi:MAG TPA: PHP domain-containing protein [Gemmatimonadaceae bacterium]|nr:PHP domain-containing protein [Gemmatimonadaceae bacterium]
MRDRPRDRYADLQLHSKASDGSDPPAEVVRRAARLGFAAIALTDHDTMAGIPEAAAQAEALGVELVPACELSTLDASERQIDILAYGVSPQDVDFRTLLAQVRGGRLGRAFAMVQRLNELGHRVSWERVQELAGSENVGRPHVARAMVEAGVVPNVKSAFTNDFIADGGRCYVQRVKISPGEAIQRIHEAGGVAVAAHPGRTRLSDDEVAALVETGLDGLEVFYPRHRRTQVARFEALAERHGLLVTGGSDDHGDINEGRLMGTIRLAWHFVERLKAAIAARAGQVALDAY